MRVTWLNAANALSLLRVPLAVIFLFAQNRSLRVAVLVAAATTDFLDGWFARRLHQTSRTGEILDPAADKLFLTTALVSLAFHRAISVGGLAVLLARDVATVAGFIIVKVRRLAVPLRSRFPGKVVTCLQLAAVLILTVSPVFAGIIVALAGAGSVWAVVDYISFGARSLRPHSATR